MAQLQIKKVSIKHDAIMDWLIANPAMQMQDCAAYFGVTKMWLSIIVNSDVFQAKLAEKNRDVFDATIVPLREKLLGVSHRAVEKLGEAVDNSQDAKFLLDAADKTLHRLGYAPSRGPEAAPGSVVNNIQQNNYVVDKDTLSAARTRMLEGAKAQAVPALPEGGNPEVPTSE